MSDQPEFLIDRGRLGLQPSLGFVGCKELRRHLNEPEGTGAVCLHMASDFCATFWHSTYMPTRPSKKKPLDFSQIALEVVEAATHTPLIQKPTDPPKNPAAVALGLLGASKGGKARAKSLSPKKRSQIAKKAAKTRWNKG